MNRWIYIAFIFIIWNGASGPLLSQSSICLDAILDFQEKLHTWTAKEYPHAIHFRYEIKMIDWDNIEQKSKIDFYRKGKTIHFFSDDVQLIQDEKDMFLLIPKEQTILRKPNSELSLSEESINSFIDFQEQYLRACTVLKCENNSQGINIDLKTPSDMKGVPFLERIRYRFNSDNGNIRTVESWFNKGYQVQFLQQSFSLFQSEVDYNFGKSARSWFLTSSGQLKPAFRSYQFIDEEN